MAVHPFIIIFDSCYAVLCKRTTSNDQILRRAENVNHDGKFLDLHFEFHTVFHIHFRDSFEKVEQTKRLMSEEG